MRTRRRNSRSRSVQGWRQRMVSRFMSSDSESSEVDPHELVALPNLWPTRLLTLSLVTLCAWVCFDTADRFDGYLDNTKQLHVQRIVVHGVRNLDKDAVIEASEIELGAKLLDIKTERSTQLVVKMPWVKSARVAVQHPDLVEIYVKERQPAALVNNDGQLVVIDSSGQLIEPATTQVDTELPIVNGIDIHLLGSGNLAELETKTRKQCRVRAARPALAASGRNKIERREAQEQYLLHRRQLLAKCRSSRRQLRDLRDQVEQEHALLTRALKLIADWNQTPLRNRFSVGELHINPALGFTIFRLEDGAEVRIGWDDGDRLPRRLDQLAQLLHHVERKSLQLRYARLDDRFAPRRVVYDARGVGRAALVDRIHPAGPAAPRAPRSQNRDKMKPSPKSTKTRRR